MKMKRGVLSILMALALCIGLLPAAALADEGDVVFDNNGYPYGTQLDKSNDIILTVDAALTEGSGVLSYQWQSATAKNGEYANINNATDKNLTFVPTDQNWYRCLVNNVPSKAVQLLEISNSMMASCEVLATSYSSYWQVSNGTMAYTVKRDGNLYTNFAVLGKYTKDSTTYWVNTDYSNGWQLFTRETAPQAGEDGDDYSGDAQLKALRVSFDEADPNTVIVEAELAEGQTAFALGADVMLGNYSITDYSDKASLKAIFQNGKISSVQMVAAESLAAAKETDAAFVLKYTGQTPSHYWLGIYYDRMLWVNHEETQGNDNLVVENGIVTEVSGIDSGMTTSWTNVESGKVQFSFSIGSVADTGAVIINATANSVTVSDSKTDTYYALFAPNGNQISDWTIGNGGDLVFTEGVQPGTTYIVKSVKASDFNTDDKKPNDNVDIDESEVTTPNLETEPDNTSTGRPTTYPPIIKESDNGNVTVSDRYPTYGEKMTVTAKPDDGFVVDKVVITDKNGDAVQFTDNGDGTYSFKQPRCKVNIDVTFKTDTCDGGISCPSRHLTDVDTNAWYHQSVDYVVENDLLLGTSSTTFSPNLTTTRGMLVTILYRLEDEPAISSACPFDDVKAGSYYEDAITWAAANNIVAGDGAGKVSPDDAITREQMVAILYRYAQSKGYDTSASADISVFSDAAQISNWALDAIKWACGEELIQGNNAQLMPQGNAIRCQVAAILMRFCELIK